MGQAVDQVHVDALDAAPVGAVDHLPGDRGRLDAVDRLLHPGLEVLEAGDDFKFNVALVVIDFLIRRGFIGPERADYPALVHGLRLPGVPDHDGQMKFNRP